MNIETEFDNFFEFNTNDRQYVTSISCKLFATAIAKKAIEEYKAGLVPVAWMHKDIRCTVFEEPKSSHELFIELYTLGETK